MLCTCCFLISTQLHLANEPILHSFWGSRPSRYWGRPMLSSESQQLKLLLLILNTNDFWFEGCVCVCVWFPIVFTWLCKPAFQRTCKVQSSSNKTLCYISFRTKCLEIKLPSHTLHWIFLNSWYATEKISMFESFLLAEKHDFLVKIHIKYMRKNPEKLFPHSRAQLT